MLRMWGDPAVGGVTTSTSDALSGIGSWRRITAHAPRGRYGIARISPGLLQARQWDG